MSGRGIFTPSTTLAALLFAASTSAPAQFTPADKPAALAAAANADRATFGYVSVPENRRNPANDRRISVAVVVVAARSANPRPDPVFYFVGGPGGSATLSSSGIPLFEALNEDRDIVFADPRGAGLSIPVLGTPAGGRTIAAFTSRNFGALRSAGIDPSGYNTTEISEDYENVRVALGYERINVVANSYGTFVAQEYLRRHSPSVRAMVMTGNSPATDSFIPTSLEIQREGLEALFRDVERNRRARRQYRNLRDRYFRLVARLDRNPLEFETAAGQSSVSGRNLLSLTSALLQRTETIRLVPLLVQQLERGPLSQLPARFFPPSSSGGGDAGPNSFGMYLSTLATDFAAPNYTTDTITNVNADPRPVLRNVPGTSLIQLAAIIESWTVPYRPGTTRRLPFSNVQTLFLNGQMDAQTPASGGATIRERFPMGTNYVYPRIGHAVGFLPGPDLDAAVAFIDVPARRPAYTVGQLLRRDFYPTRQPAREARSVEDFRDSLIDPPIRPPELNRP